MRTWDQTGDLGHVHLPFGQPVYQMKITPPTLQDCCKFQVRSPSPGLDASFNGKCCDLRILSTSHGAFHRIKVKFLLSEYVFKVPVVSVSKYHVQILALPLQAHQPPSEADLHRFRQCPHVYPVPHMIWPMGSPSNRSEGQGYLFLAPSPKITSHCFVLTRQTLLL